MNIKMLKDDGSVDQMVLPDLDSPSLYNQTESEKRARWILSNFEETHKTESAFYLTFNRIDRNDIAFLKSLWKLENDWAVFCKLCMIYKIRCA